MLLTPPTSSLEPALDAIATKVANGARLNHEDGVALFRSRDIFTIGKLADAVRTRMHGRATYYNVNRHLNYSNFCVLRCKFCSFYRPYEKQGDHAADAYEFSADEIVQIARDAVAAGATELHMVGGLHPKLPFEWYVDLCRAIKAACPNLHLKAFTAIEIVHFTRIAKPRMTIEQVLTALRDAGLDSMPGGGAEIFDDRVHDEAFKTKVGEQHWFDVHRTAHDLGIPTNATMLYGHIETPEERVTHLLKLRDHQDQSLANAGVTLDAVRDGSYCRAMFEREMPPAGAFNCLIPLSFIPDGSEFAHLPGPTGLDDLKTLAISRLLLDSFPHIKAFWIMQTPKLSQVSLNWGVDDFDGTVVWYDITKREGQGTQHQELNIETISRMIREAGCEPVERDSLYRRIERDAAGKVLSPVTTR